MAGKRKAKQLVVPDIAEDAAERKRVLNILAQRRYRQRRKERLQALESQAKSPASLEPPRSLGCSSSRSGSQPSQESDISPTGDSNGSHSHLKPGPILSSAPQIDPLVNPSTDDPFLLSSFAWPDLDLGLDLDISIPNLEPENIDVPVPDLSSALQTSESSTFSFPDDYLLDVPSLTLLNAATKVAQRLNMVDLIWDLTAISPFYQPGHTDSPSMSPPSLTSATSSQLSVEPSENENENNNENKNENKNNLPPHLHPTPTQRLIPHHPLLDLLPWPATRDKFIQVFHLPVHLRPKSAQDPMSLVRLVYDMEDGGGEGMIMQGTDPFEMQGWEIGQVMFERWWWAFDVDVVERSNRARSRRGKRGLVLDFGSDS